MQRTAGRPGSTTFERVEIVGDYRRVAVTQYAANPETICTGTGTGADTATSDGADATAGTGVRYVTVGDTAVSLRKLTGAGWRRGRLHSRRDHVVLWARDGHGTLRAEDGTVADMGPEGPTLLTAGMEYEYETDVGHLTMLHVSDALVREALAVGDAAPRVLLGQWAPHAGSDPLHRAVHELGPRIVDPTLTDQERASVDRAIADALVRTVPRDQESGERSNTVQLAVVFIREHAAQPITIEDIAAAAMCSERSLQDRFAKDIGTTPTGYLRTTRMRMVREALREAVPGAVSVGDTARAWSIGHLGRFAADYRRQFGELPTATLRRTPGGYRV